MRVCVRESVRGESEGEETGEEEGKKRGERKQGLARTGSWQRRRGAERRKERERETSGRPKDSVYIVEGVGGGEVIIVCPSVASIWCIEVEPSLRKPSKDRKQGLVSLLVSLTHRPTLRQTWSGLRTQNKRIRSDACLPR